MERHTVSAVPKCNAHPPRSPARQANHSTRSHGSPPANLWLVHCIRNRDGRGCERQEREHSQRTGQSRRQAALLAHLSPKKVAG